MAKLIDHSLYRAKIYHKRITPNINEFSYNIFYLFLNIKKLKNTNLKLLSFNKFNLFSFFNSDHAERKNNNNIEAWINNILSKNNLESKVKSIFLLTQPRVLGYVFNPVSFWFCLDNSDNLIAVLSEVNNTFGEHHNYLIYNKDYSAINSDKWYYTNKEFHVSPFFEVNGNYKFRFVFNNKKIAIWINYYINNKPALLTSVICKRDKLNDFKLLSYFFLFPILGLKVIFLIHWQALKLFLKANKFYSKPKQKLHKLTINNE